MDNSDNDNIRTIVTLSAAAAPAPAKKTIEKAPPKKKHITTTTIWKNITPTDLIQENQWRMLLSAREFFSGSGASPPPAQYKVLMQHISQKLYSYRSQDQAKNKYNAAEFIDISGVLDLLVSTEMVCHYCMKKVMLLYEFVREPMQWSLDRIDNTIGHNRGNLYIACLSCNLHRRCLFPEKYVFTKTCVEIRKLDS